MTFKASLLVSADGKQAQSELKKVEGALDKAGRSAERMGRKGKAAAGQTDRIGRASRGAASAAGTLAGAQDRAAASALRLEGANRRATAQVGNLTAQFNDIGMMMMAGQNPLQLAIQQGTQITQVIGPMGATGAVKALGSAFLSLLSPINLITLGSIAAGAAMVNWLTDAGEEAKSFADTVEELGGAVDAYREIVDQAGDSTASLAERFGSGAGAAREYLLALAEVKRREALIGAVDVGKALTGGLGSYRQGFQVNNIADQFGLTVGGIAGARRKAARQLVGAVIVAYEQLDAATKGSLEEQIAAWERTYDAVRAASEAVDGVSRAENERLSLIAQQILRLRELQAADEAAARTAQNAWAEYIASRQRGAEFLARAQAREREVQARIYRQYVQTRAEAAAQTRSAEDLLDKLERQNALQEAILRHGEGSAEVARLRAEAEGRVFEEMLAGMDVSEAMKDELRQAFEHGQALANLDIAGGIQSASQSAQELADWLGIGLETATRLVAMGPQGVPGAGEVGGGRGGDPRQFGGSFADWQNRDAIQFLDNWRPARGGGLGGASGRDSVAEARRAYEQLRASVDQTYAAELRLKTAEKDLAAAIRLGIIEKEDAELVLIRLRERLDETHSAATEFGNSFKADFIDALAGARDLGDVFDTLAQKIKRAALEALLFNEGMFAIQGGGKGLLGGLFGALTVTSVGTFHEGGVAGSPTTTRSVAASLFAGAQRFHYGGLVGLRHDEVPAILQRGERVLSRREVAAGAGVTTLRVVLDDRLIGEIVDTSVAKSAQVSVQLVQAGAEDMRAGFGAMAADSGRRGV